MYNAHICKNKSIFFLLLFSIFVCASTNIAFLVTLYTLSVAYPWAKLLSYRLTAIYHIKVYLLNYLPRACVFVYVRMYVRITNIHTNVFIHSICIPHDKMQDYSVEKIFEKLIVTFFCWKNHVILHSSKKTTIWKNIFFLDDLFLIKLVSFDRRT